MHKMLFAGVALLALATPGHARSMSYVCNGTVGVYPLSVPTPQLSRAMMITSASSSPTLPRAVEFSRPVR